jgi:hypothetical protein
MNDYYTYYTLSALFDMLPTKQAEANEAYREWIEAGDLKARAERIAADLKQLEQALAQKIVEAAKVAK